MIVALVQKVQEHCVLKYQIAQSGLPVDLENLEKP